MGKFLRFLVVCAAFLADVVGAAELCKNAGKAGAVKGVITCGGSPKAGVTVTAYDYDANDNRDDKLGTKQTRSDGEYFIRYSAGSYGATEKCPDIYIKVGSIRQPKKLAFTDDVPDPEKPTILNLDICPGGPGSG